MKRRTSLRNIGASVRARLTQLARERNENVQLALTRYAIERLLFRLSKSSYRDLFVLKGAMLFSLWSSVPYRATGDLDLLGYGDPAPARVTVSFREICSVDVEDDGVIFKPSTLKSEMARPEDEYGGVQVTLDAEIAGARLPIRIDVGFGDVVTPGIQNIEYPSLLDMPRPKLRAYPPETVVSEKFQALVMLGAVNSRMKDFFDLWAISETFAFEGLIFAEAIRATFERRATTLPADTPVALTSTFADDPAKQAQWRGFLRRTAIAFTLAPFSDILHRIDEFVMPPTNALRLKTTFSHRWKPGGQWIAP